MNELSYASSKDVSNVSAALLGALFLYLEQRAVDSVGASTIEEVNRLPSPVVAPVLLVGVVAKNAQTFALLPALAGFVTHQLALLAQAAYPNGWWSDEQEADGPSAAEQS